jgi:hypothetical protein
MNSLFTPSLSNPSPYNPSTHGQFDYYCLAYKKAYSNVPQQRIEDKQTKYVTLDKYIIRVNVQV